MASACSASTLAAKPEAGRSISSGEVPGQRRHCLFAFLGEHSAGGAKSKPATDSIEQRPERCRPRRRQLPANGYSPIPLPAAMSPTPIGEQARPAVTTRVTRGQERAARPSRRGCRSHHGNRARSAEMMPRLQMPGRQQNHSARGAQSKMCLLRVPCTSTLFGECASTCRGTRSCPSPPAVL